MASVRARRTPYVLLMVVLSVASAALFIALYALDRHLAGPAQNGILRGLIDFDVDTLQNTLGNMAQVVAAVIGIVITVASIIVQLAATRYTPRIADLFFRDRTNLLVLGFFVVSGILSVWVSVTVTHNFVPRITVVATLILVTLSLLMMVPYFAYVFAFLDPEKVVRRIREQARFSVLRVKDVTGDELVELHQLRALGSLEQLADIAINAVSQKDKGIASDSIDAIKDFTVTYLHEKGQLPKEWFTLRKRLRENPEFVALAFESVNQIETRGTWLEWQCLRQLQSLFLESMGDAPAISQLVAIDARYIGEAALATKHTESLELTLKFFNTFLRVTLNARDVRAAYNLLNQYRQLAERVLKDGNDALVVEIAQYFRYYGQIAQSLNLSFVTETVAYDLGRLCEKTWRQKSSAHEQLLTILLDLDQQPDDPTQSAQEATLRGVRKAQAKLAAFYMENGEDATARRIFHDMRDEHLDRLRSIFSELLSVENKDYWEVIDRGTNFDYLLPPHKEQLKRFVSWFQVV